MREELERRADLIDVLSRKLSKDRIDELRSKSLSIVDFIKNSSKVITTTSDFYESPARYASIIFSSITDKDVRYVDSEDLMYYIAPYDESRESSVIIYSSSEGLHNLRLLTDQLTWTNHRVLVVAQSKLGEDLEYRLSGNVVVNLGTDEWLLHAHVITSLAAVELAPSESLRKARIVKELNSLDAKLLEDLLQAYDNVLRELRKFVAEPFITTASPSMWGVAEEIVYKRSYNTYLVRPEAVPRHVSKVKRVLIISTDVEEYSLKSVRGLSITQGVEVFSLNLRTDPLTSPIYGLLLIEFL